MFEIIVAVIVLWAIGSFISGGKKGSKKSSKPAVKDFVKDGPHTLEEAANIVARYAYVGLGFSEKISEELGQEFIVCCKEITKSLKHDRNTWDEEWMKGYQWYQKKIDIFQSDYTPYMKKYMNLMKGEYFESPFMISAHEIRPESWDNPPESIYADDDLDDEEMEKKRKAWEVKNK